MRWNSILALAATLLLALSCKGSASSQGGLERSNTSERSGLAAFKETRWKSDLGAERTPLLVGGKLIVVQKKAIATLGDDGQPASKVDLKDSATGPMTVVSGVSYYGEGKTLRARRLESGDSLWGARLRRTVSAAPAVFGDTVLATGGDLVALDAATGDERWSFEGEGDFVGAPAVSNEHVFVGSSKGYLYAVDLGTGQARWTARTGSSFRSAVAVASDMLVAPGEDGVVWGVFAETGRERWRFDTHEVISTGVAMRGDRVWVGTEGGNLSSINIRTGQEVWRMADLPAVVTTPEWAAGLLYVGCDDGKLVVLNADEGTLAWSFQMESAPVGSPLLGDGELWLTDDGGRVYALE